MCGIILPDAEGFFDIDCDGLVFLTCLLICEDIFVGLFNCAYPFGQTFFPLPTRPNFCPAKSRVEKNLEQSASGVFCLNDFAMPKANNFRGEVTFVGA